jgi:hypothetical protein
MSVKSAAIDPLHAIACISPSEFSTPQFEQRIFARLCLLGQLKGYQERLSPIV